MRNEKDLIRIDINLLGALELDLERMIEDDPVWRTIATKYDFGEDSQKRAAVHEYIEYYLVRERFLSRMPSTNGPGTLRITSMEVRFYGDHGNTAAPNESSSRSGVAAKDQG